MYTSFGKNRVSSNNYNWQNTNNTLITIYYYDNGFQVANNAIEIATNETKDVEKQLGATLSQPVNVILYNNIHQYRQSNIELSSAPINPAGFSNIRQNIFPVYFDGDYNHLKKQLRQALANAILTDLFYGGTIQEKVRTNVLFSLPDWYYKGLLAYIAEPWNVQEDDEMRDKIESNSFQNFNTLSKEDELLAGKSLWYYLASNNGKDAVASIVFWTQYERSAEGALMRSTGTEMSRLLRNWRLWFTSKYADENRLGNLPRGTENSPEKIAKYKHTRFTISPNGKYMAIVTNNSGLVKVWLYNTKNKSTKLLQKIGYKSEIITPDNVYPLIAWHPSSKKIGIITYHNGKDELKEIGILNLNSKFIDIGKHDGVRDFCYSPGGDSVVLSAFSRGQSDLFYVGIKTKKITPITNDYYLDINPSFLPNGDLIFASKRPKDKPENETILNVSNYPTAIFKINEIGKISAIGNPKFGANYYAPLYYNNGLITCLTDETGVVNAVVTSQDSNAEFQFVSNYKRNILYQDIAAETEQLAELVLFNEKYYIYLSSLATDVLKESSTINPKNTSFRVKNPIGSKPINTKTANKKKAIIDSLSQDSIVFLDSVSKIIQPYFLSNFPIVDYEITDAQKAANTQPASCLAEKSVTNFFMNYLVTQTDNSNQGFPYYPIEMDSFALLVPFFSFNAEAEAADIFRNYIFKGGIRIHGDLNGHDYHLKFQALKYRVDFDAGAQKRYRSVGNVGEVTEFKQAEMWAGASYPFSERSKLRLSVAGKQDRVMPGLDNELAVTLPIIDRRMAITTLQWVFDNSMDKGINKTIGIRSKIYSEYYQFTNLKGSMLNLGFDVRRNIPITGELIWASRLAGAYSVGKLKTIYYLGGTETAIEPKYNKTLAFAKDNDYVFLAAAPNLRGYLRNASHGYSTTVLSTELRFPIISHFYKAPLSNQFYKTFTLSSFMDLGGAWNGINPYNSEIPSNTVTYNLPNYTIKATSPGNPWLLGTGFGVRANVLGYLFKLERGWGVANGGLLPGVNYISIGLDF